MAGVRAHHRLTHGAAGREEPAAFAPSPTRTLARAAAPGWPAPPHRLATQVVVVPLTSQARPSWQGRLLWQHGWSGPPQGAQMAGWSLASQASPSWQMGALTLWQQGWPSPPQVGR